ncbi:MAG: ATP-binding protein [Syntrophobacteraceae bacterium]
MVELVVVSGKGGTGKTSITGALAALAENKVLCDADVDAADLHLILGPTVRERHEFRAGHKAVIDPTKCTLCGECLEVCKFNAVSETFAIDELTCEGCGVCVHFCPAGAIDFPESVCGEWLRSDTRFGPMIHARLGIAEENSGKLVTLIRKEARELAEKTGAQWIITDGPPGIGCPVIASIGGASAILAVAEPTVSGKHDLKRIVELAAHFRVPTLVCVNKADIYPEAAHEIEVFAEEKGCVFVGRIPFDNAFTEAQVKGETIVEYKDGPGKKAISKLWEEVEKQVH